MFEVFINLLIPKNSVPFFTFFLLISAVSIIFERILEEFFINLQI
tara:strand:- start:1109 stop:1243 length:135 start_codon:yes stop_codon:yes gene_type:complete